MPYPCFLILGTFMPTFWTPLFIRYAYLYMIKSHGHVWYGMYSTPNFFIIFFASTFSIMWTRGYAYLYITKSWGTCGMVCTQLQMFLYFIRLYTTVGKAIITRKYLIFE